MRTAILAISFASIISLLAVAGCGGSRGGGGGSNPLDDAGCVGADCPCRSDLDCTNGRRCDTSSGRCEACLADRDCPLGTRCAGFQCAPGCGPMRGCADAAVCEVDAGACVECTTDKDCAAPTPRCSPGRYRCVACTRERDNCPAGEYCNDKSDPPKCVAGCKSDADCAAPNATTACTDGTCGIESCNAGFADCDKDARTGCEIATETDPRNCGGCGMACSDNRIAAPACAAGNCSGACNAGYADCNKDLRADGCEVDTFTDAKHCGGCGMACEARNGRPACDNAACKPVCDNGFGDCDGDGRNGCETRLGDDARNCGACGKVCSGRNGTPSCANAACRIACTDGFGDCDGDIGTGCEKDLRGDTANCGGCGKTCPAPPNASAACSQGLCAFTCNMGSGDCDQNPVNGCETALATDIKNCGACGATCPGAANATAACAGGQCRLQCAMGFGDCDNDVSTGCERSVLADPANCGACGKACAQGQTCVNGACVSPCAQGLTECGMQCVNLLIDASHCGACNRACAGNQRCTNGVCGSGACATPYVIAPEGGRFTGQMNGTGTTSGSCGYGGVDRYLSWTAPRNGTATINYTTDYWPASIYVRRSTCNGTEVICRGTAGQWPNLTFSFTAAAGTTYFIIVDASYSGPITLTFNVTVTPP